MESQNKSSVIELAQKEVCVDENHLNKYFQNIIDQGGEGIILRDPSAPFQAGSTRGYLKHKVTTSFITTKVKYSYLEKCNF